MPKLHTRRRSSSPRELPEDVPSPEEKKREKVASQFATPKTESSSQGQPLTTTESRDASVGSDDRAAPPPLVDDEDISVVYQNLMHMKEQQRRQLQEIEQLESHVDVLAATKRVSVLDLMKEYQAKADPNGAAASSLASVSSLADTSLGESTSKGHPPEKNNKKNEAEEFGAVLTKQRKSLRSTIILNSKRLSVGSLFPGGSGKSHQKTGDSNPPPGKGRRRASLSENGTSLRQFLDEQVSQKQALAMQCQDYQSQLQALKREKEELISRLETSVSGGLAAIECSQDSNTLQTQFSDLEDKHATEMEKVLQVCQEQKDRIDALQRDKASLKAEREELKGETQKKRASIQQQEIQLQKTKQELVNLKRDRKHLRQKLKQVADAEQQQGGGTIPKISSSDSDDSAPSYSSSSSPPPLLTQETKDLLDDFREQDAEAEQILHAVGKEMAMAEALKIVGLQSLNEVDSYQRKIMAHRRQSAPASSTSSKKEKSNDRALKDLKETCDRQKNELEVLKLDKEMVEEALKNAQEEKDQLKSTLEEQKKLTKNGGMEQTQKKLQYQASEIQKLENTVKEHLSKAEYYESKCVEQTLLVESLKNENSTLFDQFKDESNEFDAKIGRLSMMVNTDAEMRQRLQAAQAEVERLSKSVSGRAAKVREYKEIADAAQQKYDDASKAQKALEETLSAKDDELKQSKESNTGMSVTIETLETTLEHQKTEMDSLNRSNDLLFQEVQSLKAGHQEEVDTLQKSRDSLSSKVELLEATLEDQTTKLKDEQQQKEALVHLLQAATDECSKQTELHANLSTTHDSLQVEIQELKDSRDLVSKELEDSKAESSKLKNMVDDLSAKNVSLEEASEQYMTEIQELESKEVLTLKELGDVKAEASNLQKVVDDLSVTIKSLEEAAEKHMTEIQDLKDSKDLAAKELDGNNTEYCKLRKMVDNLFVTIKSKDEATEKHMAEIKDLKDSKDLAVKELDGAKLKTSNLQKIVDDLAATKQSLEEAVEQLRIEIKELKESKDLAAKELDVGKVESSNLQKRVGDLSATKLSLEAKVGQHEAEIQDLKESKNLVVKELDSAKVENSSLQKMVGDLAATKQSLEEAVEHHRTEIQELMDSNDLTAKRLDGAKVDISSLQKLVDELAATKQGLEEAVEQHVAKIQELKDSKDLAVKDLDGARTESCELKTKMDDMSATKESLEEAAKQHLMEIQELKDSKDLAAKELHSVQAETASLQKTVADLSKSLEESKEQNTATTSKELDDLKFEVSQLQKAHSNLTSTNESLKETIEYQLEKIQELEENSSDLQKLTATNVSLRSTVEQQNTRNRSLEERNKNLSNQIEKLKEASTHNELAMKEKRSTVDQQRKEKDAKYEIHLEHLRQLVNSHKAQNAKYEDVLKQQNSHIGSLQEEKHRNENELKNQTTRIDYLQALLEEKTFEAENIDNSKQYDELLEELRVSKMAASSVQESLIKQRAETDLLRTQLSNLQSEKEEIQEAALTALAYQQESKKKPEVEREEAHLSAVTSEKEELEEEVRILKMANSYLEEALKKERGEGKSSSLYAKNSSNGEVSPDESSVENSEASADESVAGPISVSKEIILHYQVPQNVDSFEDGDNWQISDPMDICTSFDNRGVDISYDDSNIDTSCDDTLTKGEEDLDEFDRSSPVNFQSRSLAKGTIEFVDGDEGESSVSSSENDSEAAGSTQAQATRPNSLLNVMDIVGIGRGVLHSWAAREELDNSQSETNGNGSASVNPKDEPIVSPSNMANLAQGEFDMDDFDGVTPNVTNGIRCVNVSSGMPPMPIPTDD